MTIQDGYTIDHDHRYGECIEETPDDRRAMNGRWTYSTQHYRHCKKRVEVTFFCTKRDPYVSRYSYRWGRMGRTAQECWTHRCRCALPRWKRHVVWFGDNACPTWGRVQCEGHTETHRDDSIPCVCDNFPERPTCELEPVDPTRQRWYSGGIPSEYVRAVYHRPERRRVRDEVRRLAREYNAYGDLDDGDVFNRQARSSARWLYW
jgi:hypothetical protein